VILIAATGVIAVVFEACGPPPPLNPQSLPADANDACPLSSTTFASWFQLGAVSPNGVVNPADSVNFPNIPDCSFYQWSEQMFMWLNSPTPASYGGGGGRIFDSPAFFDVSPPAADGTRTFLAHAPGLIRAFALRTAQGGPRGLQLIHDKSGRLLQVQPAEQGAKPLVRNVSGQVVEIAHAKLGKDGKPILLDKNSKAIQTQASRVARPDNRTQASTIPTAQRFVIDRIPIFVDQSLAVIDVEEGQADNGVLEAQLLAGGSLVYYATMVNDVYAYFATGQKDGQITLVPNPLCPRPNNCFPITSGDLSNITTFAAAHGKTFPDPNALAVEVKSAWVQAAGLPNLSSYITMTATIPTFSPSTNTWTPSGQTTVQLALVGMHVVGSVNGHPEMIWATFEHIANAPRAAYSYINTSNTTVNVAQNTNAAWVFSATNSTGPFNVPHMSFSSPTIVADGTFTISPSDTLRAEPWGIAGTNAFSNTEVISTNNHVRGMMGTGDVRGNYVMTGATWTPGGAFPTGTNGAGTNLLTNTTMETYQQGTTNCFTCHVNPPMLGTLAGHPPQGVGLSHVYGGLKALF
jgi:hypothetical protein